MNELEFLWITYYINISYEEYNKLNKIFGNVKNIYEATMNPDKFKIVLKKSKVYLKIELFKKLISNNLKYKAKIKLIELKQKNIKIITINDNKYSNIFNQELIIYAYGDLNILNNNKICVYNSNVIDNKSKTMQNDFCKYIKDQGIKIVSDLLNENTDIVCLEYLDIVKNDNILILSSKIEKDKNLNNTNYKLLSSISNCIFFVPTDYNIKAATLVDMFLENGKDILAIPADINNSNSYFSNFLIKCGATVITGKKDLLTEINYISNQQKNKLYK